MISSHTFEEGGALFFMRRTGKATCEVEIEAPLSMHEAIAANVRVRMGLLRQPSGYGGVVFKSDLPESECHGCGMKRGSSPQILCGLCLLAVDKLARQALAEVRV